MATANYNLNLNNDWKFHIGDLPFVKEKHIWMFHASSEAGGALQEYDIFSNEVKWENVSIPHDFMTSLPIDKNCDCGNGYKERTTAWYYKNFILDDKPIESATLVFNGVMGVSTLYVNGTLAVRNFSGYNRFSCEIGDYLIPNAENNITVYVDARRWEGWWYEGAGIYRSVNLLFRSGPHFDIENYFFRSEEVDGNWQVKAEFEVLGIGEMDCFACLTLKDKDGKVVVKKTIKVSETNQVVLPIENPDLWSPENPNLYSLSVVLKNGDKDVDVLEKFVGFRKIEWIADKGMFLNGKRYQVKGICCHQDHACVGIAVTPEIMEYRIKKLKNLGVNAYRCAHNAPSEDLLEICDRLGMLVMVENRNFSVCEDVLYQLKELVLVSRNHTSVFLYSLFNEEPWQVEKRGARIAGVLRENVLKFDDTRKIMAAQNGGMLNDSNASDVLDIIGVNYFLREYEQIHLKAPNKVLIGTENCPTYATRGETVTIPKKNVFANYGDDWGDFSERLEDTMEFVFSKPYIAGCFAWSGFDYRGEPTPHDWPSVLSHWGFTDYCGFEKDTAFLLKAYYSEELFAHLFPHWNHKEGDIVRVCCFSNGDTAELFVNGCSVGGKNIERRRAEWQVEYQAGEITVKVKKGNETVIDKVVTAGEPSKITAVVETKTNKSTYKLVNVYLTDDNGVIIPDAMNLLSFEVEHGKVIGVGNGDPNSHHLDVDTQIKLFHGKAQVVCEGKTLIVHCEGFADLKVAL